MGEYYQPSTQFRPSLISERAVDEPRPLKVIYIGAGVSGILAAIHFRKYVPSLDLVIYEKNPEIGGTWYENRYPGCACDVASHVYQLSYESWTDWSQFYADAPEILEYWKRVANKHDVRKHVRLSHKCTEAVWDESRSKWIVRLQRLDLGEPVLVEDEADVLITGTGLLNEWKWPNIPGLHDFKGDLLHTANWNDNFDPTDKKVAVIGAGSSGIQVVPAIASKVKAMDHYVRGRTWISSQFNETALKQGAHDDGATNFKYTAADHEFWRRDPAAYVEYRKSLERDLQGNYAVTQRGSLKSITSQAKYAENMRERLKAKPEVADLLIPDFPPLCKRITPGPGYLEALVEPHVSVIPQAITHIDAEGVITSDGVKREVDAIVCATGFDTSPGQGFPIYGRDGINLRDKYRIRPKTYLGLCTDNFPNFFQSLGPNTWQGGGSLLIMMEYAHDYMGQILKKLAYGNIKTIEPKRKQVENFTNYCDEYFKSTVYTANCVSWYKTATAAGEPRVTALWPGSSIHALHVLETPRWEDFELESRDGNDFGWFGNGWTMGEKDTGDNCEALTWYLNKTSFLHEYSAPVVDGEAVAVNQDHTTTTQEPAITTHDVLIAEQEPVAVVQEPVVADRAPAVTSEQLHVTNREPNAGHQEPTVTRHETVPVSNDDTLVASQEPIVADQESATKSEESTTADQRPVTKNSEPAVRQDSSEGSIEESIFISQEPDYVSKASVVVNQQPVFVN